MSIMAAVSAGLLPMNALIANFGLPLHALGDSIGAHLSGHGYSEGAANIAANGGSLNVDQTGNGNSAGGQNVNQVSGQGNGAVECTADMPATVAQAGLSSPVTYIG
jgi:hypothetical protein